MTYRTATLIGLTAILMWSRLAVFTVTTGRIPAFQLAAMTFAIGGLVGCASWLVRPGGVASLRQPLVAWVVGVLTFHATAKGQRDIAITRAGAMTSAGKPLPTQTSQATIVVQ